MFNNLNFNVMSELLDFYCEFLKQEFPGVHSVVDSHTLRLCCEESMIPQSALNFVVMNCPVTCSYFISDYLWTHGLYICVYDE